MKAGITDGTVYRCPVCGAEVAVLSANSDHFTPRCCNRFMVATRQRAVFYYCPVCGAELMVVRKGKGAFAPHCCNTAMRLKAA
jgi:endogenous inhibitor of DNA gyrase (YacG/DUF329 family)